MIAHVDFKQIAEEVVNRFQEDLSNEISIRSCDYGEGGTVCFDKEEYDCKKFLKLVNKIRKSIKLALDVAGVEDYRIDIKFNCREECCILFTQGSD